MNIHRETLNKTTDDDNEAAEPDSPFTPAIVGTVWRQKKTCEQCERPSSRGRPTAETLTDNAPHTLYGIQ